MFRSGLAAASVFCAGAGTVLPAGPPVWRSQDLLDATGVVTHIGYSSPGFAYADEQKIIAALRYLGVTNVREALPDLPIGDPRLERYYRLFRMPMKMSLTISAGGAGDLLADDKANLDDFVLRFPGQVLAVEGLNEPDIVRDGYTYIYRTWSGAEAVAHRQIETFNMVRHDPRLHKLPVWEFSLNSAPFDQTSYEQVYRADPAVLKAFDAADVGNYSGTWSPAWRMQNSLYYPYDVGVAGGRQISGPFHPEVAGRPLVVKETGVFSTPTGNARFGMPNYLVQAKLLPAILLDTFTLGASHSFVYELADLYTDMAETNLQYHWGLFDTALRPKPAATVMRHLLATWEDQSPNAKTFTPKPLSVTVPQFPLHPPGTTEVGSGFTLITENASGTYTIMVWYEPLLWNEHAGTAYPAPAPRPISVQLSRVCAKTSIYDPMTDARQTGPDRTAIVPVALPDHPILVQCMDPA